MGKKTFTLLAVLLLFVPARAQVLEVEFIGNAAIRISDGQLTVVSDFPYVSGAFGYMHYEYEAVRPEGEVVSLITHRHADHFDPARFASTAWYLVAPGDIAVDMPASRRLPVGDVIAFRDLEIRPIATPHADVEHYSYLMTWYGHTFYFTGDTESVEALEAANGVDLLFITPWLLRRAEQSGVNLSAKRIVVYHHQQGEEVVCRACSVLQQGDQFYVPSRAGLIPAPEVTLFAPGVISTGNANDELFPTFTPSGDTLYFVRRVPEGPLTIYSSRFEEGRWTNPEVASFSGVYADQEPFIAPDGRKLFFTSNRPIDGTEPIEGRDTWVVERTDDGWSEPRHVGEPISYPPPPAGSDNRFLGLARGPRVDHEGTLYFWAERPEDGYGNTDLYRSRLLNGQYAEPENLGPIINSEHYETAAIRSAGGDFMLFSRDCLDCPNALGRSDIYISHFVDGAWTEPRNLGPKVNSSAYDFGPVLSPDGRYLFFSSNRNANGEEPGRQNIYFIELEALDLWP